MKTVFTVKHGAETIVHLTGLDIDLLLKNLATGQAARAQAHFTSLLLQYDKTKTSLR